MKKKVQCIGMVGKFPTPEGLLMFYDTGRCLSPLDLAEAMALQHSYFSKGVNKEEVSEKLYRFMNEVEKKVDVYPIGQAAIADDGRILVTEPFFESKELK